MKQYIPRYPISAEREYVRIVNTYNQMLTSTVGKYLPQIKRAYKKYPNDFRTDSFNDLSTATRKTILEMLSLLLKKIRRYNLQKRLESISNMALNLSVDEFGRLIKREFRIDIFKDYYKGGIYKNKVNQWVAQNVSLMNNYPSNLAIGMQNSITKAFQEGWSVDKLSNELQDLLKVTKNYAEYVARDQMSTLSSNLSEMQQRDAGCTKYRWSTSKDERVRPCHKSFEGKIFSWDSPPEIWYETKSKGRVYTGRYCHPGQDYLCRCVAIPVFDTENLNIVTEPNEGER